MSIRKTVLWGVGLALCASLAFTEEVRVKVAKANLRATASTSAAIVAKVEQGKTLQVIETSGQWVKVKNGGAAGWIHSSLVEKIAAVPAPAATAAAAPAAAAQTPKPAKARKSASKDKPIALGIGASLANKSIGFGAHGRVTFTPMKKMPDLRVVGAVDYFFKNDGLLQITGNAAYAFPISSKEFRPYVGAGLVFSSANGETSTDLDIAAGVEYKKRVFGEVRMILEDESVLVVSAGIRF
jgi:hypothetical protein